VVMTTLDSWPVSGACLSAAETERRARYMRDGDRRRFALGRALLRAALPGQAGVPLLFGPYGKPWLPDGPAFSISHAAGTVALAVAPAEPIGLDVEAQAAFARRADEAFAIADADERAWLGAGDDAERPMRRLRCWTRKEAVLKALGVGFAREPTTIATRPDLVAPVLPIGEGLRVVDLEEDGGRHGGAVAFDAATTFVRVIAIGCVWSSPWDGCRSLARNGAAT
ncbi:4'-phosphopantetheinyl transferase superfamily protein, partial [Rhodoplanes sp. TEM]